MMCSLITHDRYWWRYARLNVSDSDTQEFWWGEWEPEIKTTTRKKKTKKYYSWITTWLNSSDYNMLKLNMSHNTIKIRIIINKYCTYLTYHTYSTLHICNVYIETQFFKSKSHHNENLLKLTESVAKWSSSWIHEWCR